MAVKLKRVMAALNAYPWTPGTLARDAGRAARYCAVGQLLRYAGMPYKEVRSAARDPKKNMKIRRTLKAEYGIEAEPVHITWANDISRTQDEAIRRVLKVVSGKMPRRELLAWLTAEEQAFETESTAPDAPAAGAWMFQDR